MLYFCRPLTEVHGCLVTAGDKQEEVVGSVVAAVRRVRGGGAEEEEAAVSRRVHLFLALNTYLCWPEQVAQLDSLASCAGLVRPLPLPTYLQIVRNQVDNNHQSLKSQIAIIRLTETIFIC